MKKLIVALFCIGMLGFAGASAWAQGKATAPQPTSVKTIWDYKTQLGLSSTQVNDMKAALRDFQKQLITLRASLQVSELNLQDLLQKHADLDTVKTQLQKSADIQVDMRIADVETARKIEGVLTPDQLTKWRAIQKAAKSARASGKR